MRVASVARLVLGMAAAGLLGLSAPGGCSATYQQDGAGIGEVASPPSQNRLLDVTGYVRDKVNYRGVGDAQVQVEFLIGFDVHVYSAPSVTTMSTGRFLIRLEESQISRIEAGGANMIRASVTALGYQKATKTQQVRYYAGTIDLNDIYLEK